MAIYLSMSMLDEVARILMDAYGEKAPCAVVYRASQPEQKIIVAPLNELTGKVRAEKITKQAVIVIGKTLEVDKNNFVLKSKLYDKQFKHEYRK
jgi:precorrin-4/cobalt-precorrin-4 C11-methyltransferase